jgi:hypothetical protein
MQALGAGELGEWVHRLRRLKVQGRQPDADVLLAITNPILDSLLMQAFDAGELGEWVHRLRRLKAQGRLPAELAARLEGVGFAWRVDNITAKWYHNLHVARRYKVSGSASEMCSVL